MYAEDDLLPISALQHLLFCPRQCALIHVEQLWAENALTREGRHLHRTADAGRGERKRAGRGGGRVARGLLLRSIKLGLFGKADVVEFHDGPAGGTPADRAWGGAAAAVAMPGVSAPASSSSGSPSRSPSPSPVVASRPVPFPVEYKRGKPKKDGSDRVQLCAQALCLEEMLATPVPAGAIFYGTTRRRLDVPFDAPLRHLTLEAVARLRAMVDARATPPAVREKKCDRCSLLHLCLPGARPGTPAASRYLGRVLAAAGAGGGDAEVAVLP